MQDKGKFNLIDEDLHGSGGSQFQWRIVNSKKQPSFEQLKHADREFQE